MTTTSATATATTTTPATSVRNERKISHRNHPGRPVSLLRWLPLSLSLAQSSKVPRCRRKEFPSHAHGHDSRVDGRNLAVTSGKASDRVARRLLRPGGRGGGGGGGVGGSSGGSGGGGGSGSFTRGVATVSLGSVEVGAKGREVSCDLALVAVVAAEAEAAAVTKTGGEEVGPGETGSSPDFVRRRHKFYPYPHFHLSPFPSPVTLPYESGKFRGVCHWPPETLSTA
ncbi:hypothetical protein ALC57_11500 [Trachymyrmex cornetzi]|uniref:Uncharacterized protein n=1 Tax=Trachymyrmex cornetzi TaxID=471704 RepID=A0A195DUQ6_9HYME|nr:hypothetical protein ALC57_11500 [Trachymyrmex cornetzi]